MAVVADHETKTFGLGRATRLATHLVDLRTSPPDAFRDVTSTDWSSLTWSQLGRPTRTISPESEGSGRGAELPDRAEWERHNRALHALFRTNVPKAQAEARRRLASALRGLDLGETSGAIREITRIEFWNRLHRVTDAVWDPRGKRALFQGLDIERPRILLLGAGDGYEALQLLAMYPGGEAVLVDHDDFCRTDRFGAFPADYPFLGRSPVNGCWRTYRRADFDIDFVVGDIRELSYGREFDIVASVGLVERWPDEHKPLLFDLHRRFLRPGGYAVVTATRGPLHSKLFDIALRDNLYRERIDAHQLGLYAYESGFEVLRAARIRAHSGIIARER